MSRSSSSTAAAQTNPRRRSLRQAMVAIGLALAVSLLPTIVLAETTLGYKVTGLQVGVAPADGNFVSSFAGVAASTPQAGEFGLWRAAVLREEFDTNGHAILLGGTFRLKSNVRIVDGTFITGTVDRKPAATGCVNEVFVVHGEMTAVTDGGEALAGTFDATLTHFRRAIFGRPCRTLGATVTGVVNLKTPGP